ncbi:MAG: prolipoprotein diacylglyceryl transferase [Deltaproteobacteria bacterium]|nr:prolipoprotein diacylglyceryl transferase [Deltaproteobacteria bacterium]MBN2673202.1 prolipoprotein diacylglyceryl transferase [Deltaproteobacteria bacterium]
MYPVLFTIPFINLPIHSYGVMLGTSIVIGWFITIRLAKPTIPEPMLKKLILISALSALLGARLLSIATTFSSLDFSNPLSLLIPGHTGLVAYGGFLGGFLGAYLYNRKKNISLLAFADATSPSLALGLGITRIGCFLYGCDFGKPIPEDAPTWIQKLGVQFPNWTHRFADNDAFQHHAALVKGAPAFWHHVYSGALPESAAQSLLVFPAQLLASLNGWFALALTFVVRKHAIYRGQVFLFFVMYYGISRTLIEFVRDDTGRGVLYVLTTSQWIGLTSFAVAFVTHLKQRNLHSGNGTTRLH